ncbi:MAG: hypothetical protein RL696_343 [Actinomycetota bacterium]|jgi:hypothetical protein
MKAVFIDETKSKKFTLTAVFVDVERIPTIRLELTKLRMKGQRRIHFVDESHARRRHIASELEQLGVHAIFYVSRSKVERLARKHCLTAMVASLDKGSNYQIWLELDESHVSNDKAAITKALATNGMLDKVEFLHVSPHQQELLWIADALGWIKNRGAEWSRTLRRFSHQVLELD